MCVLLCQLLSFLVLDYYCFEFVKLQWVVNDEVETLAILYIGKLWC